MDTSSSVVLALTAAVAGLLRIRAIVKHGSFRLLSPSFFVGASVLLCAAAFVAAASLTGPFLNGCVLFFLAALSLSHVPAKIALTQDGGCKYTPLVASTFSLIKVLVGSKVSAPVYLIVGLALFVASCAWLAAPRIRVKINSMCDSDIKSCMQDSAWPAFDIVDRNEEMTLNIASSNGDDVSMEKLDNGIYQVHARGKGSNIVRRIKREWWS